MKTLAILSATALLLPGARAASADEQPLLLLERVIIGEDRSPEPETFSLEPSRPPRFFFEPGLYAPAPPPTAGKSRYLSFGLGSHEKLDFSVHRELDAGHLAFQAGRRKPPPFRETALEIEVSGGLARRYRHCRAEALLSLGYHDNLPAARHKAGDFVPGAFPGTGTLTLGFHAVFLPLGTTRPELIVRHRFFTRTAAEGKYLLAPRWTAEIAVASMTLPRTAIRVFLKFDESISYGGDRQVTSTFTPGLTVNRHLAGGHYLALTAENPAGGKKEILPDHSGPGFSAFLNYSLYY